MHSFTGKLLLYSLAWGIYIILSRSPYGLDQLYDQQIQDSIYDSYFSIYLYISVSVIGLLLCRSLYYQFRSRSKQAISIYFRRFGLLKILNSIFAFVLFSYLLIHLIHCSVLYINRIQTTAIYTTSYKYGQNNIEDDVIQKYLYHHGPNQNAKFHQQFQLTTKKGLLKLPYQITINPL